MTFSKRHSVSAISQETIPLELPVSGEPGNETKLALNFPGGDPLFALEGKKLRLLRPLDRDETNLSHVVLQVRWHQICSNYQCKTVDHRDTDFPNSQKCVCKCPCDLNEVNFWTFAKTISMEKVVAI